MSLTMKLPSIESLFANPNIRKYGIGTEYDKKKFAMRFPDCAFKSWLDLGDIAKKVCSIRAPGHGPLGQLHGVNSLCAALLNKFFEDEPQLTFTDWELEELEDKHRQYMALDAWLCAKIGYLLIMRVIAQAKK